MPPRQARRSKLPDAQKEEAKRKLSTPIEYQGELTRYTWSLCLADAVDRDQLRALKIHFKKTIEELWQVESSQRIAEQQARELFKQEWTAFEEECRGSGLTSKPKREEKPAFGSRGASNSLKTSGFRWISSA